MGDKDLTAEDLVMGIESGLRAQEQVASEFQDLVDYDIAAAADRYGEFAEKLEKVASDGNAQLRSMMGGPDSATRARLIEIMVGSYETASDDVKAKIRDEAMKPLLRDNLFYIRLAVAQMNNPFLVGDIIREHPAANPGANYYEEDLQKSGAAKDPDLLQFWLSKFRFNMFAATTIALQRDDHRNVARVISDNEELFQAAAHVTAATHDLLAEITALKGTKTPKVDLLRRYCGSFVDDFVDLVRIETEQARWLPISRAVIDLYSQTS